jgi:hypothetical protein
MCPDQQRQVVLIQESPDGFGSIERGHCVSNKKRTGSPIEEATAPLRVLYKFYFVMGMISGWITPQ